MPRNSWADMVVAIRLDEADAERDRQLLERRQCPKEAFYVGLTLGLFVAAFFWWEKVRS